MHKYTSRGRTGLFTLGIFCGSALWSGCSISFHGSAKTGGSSESARGSSSTSSGKVSGSASGKGSSKADAAGRGSGKSSGGGKDGSGGRVSVGAKGGGRVVFASKERSKKVGKSDKGDSFQATDLVGGGGSAKASGSGNVNAGSENDSGGSDREKTGGSGSAQVDNGKRGSGSAQVDNKKRGSGSAQVENRKRDEPGTGSAQVESGARAASSKKDDEKKRASKEEKKPSKKGGGKEKDREPVAVIDPPPTPPENVFGYEEPVRGCFEGVVYPLSSGADRLPRNFSRLTGISVVYACEWDIPTRDWGQGFPGVEERFEWFAIRYTGSFSVQQAGTWKFRISSDDGAKLYVDGKVILDNDGAHPPQQKSVKVPLSAGDHDMVLEYFQGPRYHINLQLFATPPGGEEGVFSVR